MFVAGLENFELDAIDRDQGGFGEVDLVGHCWFTLRMCASAA
jgi:hypothetical protein